MLFLKLFILHFLLSFETHRRRTHDRRTSKIRKTLLWHPSPPKISRKIVCNNFENGGLKNFHITWNIVNLQSSWIRKLYEENISFFPYISKYLGKLFKFYSCLSFGCQLPVLDFPNFTKHFFRWSSFLFASSKLPSCILSNFLWFNKHILIFD